MHLVFGAGVEVEQPAPDPTSVEVTVQLSDPTVTALVLYDNRNPRRVTTAAEMPHQPAQSGAAAAGLGWGLSTPMIDPTATPWGLAQSARREFAAAWDISGRLATERAAPWVKGVARTQQTALVHQAARPVAVQSAARWALAQALATQSALVHQAARSHVAHVIAPWGLTARVQALVVARHGSGVARLAEMLMPWQTSRPVPPGREVWPKPGAGAFVPRVPTTRLVFACPPAWAGSGPVHLLFGRVCNLPPVQPGLVVVPVRSLYMILNSSSLRRVDNNAYLPALSMGLTIDADSWTWGFSADLPADAMPMLSRTSQSEPVEVEMVINGTAYRALIENISRSRSFQNRGLTVRGRGLAAVLDEPFAPVSTFGNTVGRTAQQLAGDALTINGESIGWNIDWQIDDWLVPANAWSHQGSMISAVNRIAAAAGGYLQPHNTARTLRVLPRYPSAPWEWSSVVPDFELPAAAMSVETIEWVDRPDFNRVFVGGISAGFNGQVTRTGTAGDVLAPAVADGLMTDADAIRQRGIAELAKGGRWANMTLRLPVLSETGAIPPGKFVRYHDGEVNRLGITRTLSVQDDGTEIWQSIGVEAYVA